MAQTKRKLEEANRCMIEQVEQMFKGKIPKFIFQEKNELRKNKLLFDFAHSLYLEKLENQC